MDPERYDKEDTPNPLLWWQQRQNEYLGLAQMAFDVLSIPLMSDDNERSNSSGRDMIAYRRTRLRNDIIEACQCLKNWYGDTEEIFDDEEAIMNEMDAADDD